MKYSIITPNYNGFSLMEPYFRSLEEQTYKDFEVIVVDDCSTDGSYEKLKEYEETTALALTVLRTTTNSGPGNARNIGMDAAQGEWITFIDNDDWVETSLLSEIDDIIQNNDVNCIIYDYYIKSEHRTNVSKSMYEGNMGKVSLSECLIYTRNHSVGKVYRLNSCREKNVKFPSLRRCEDVAFVARAIEACGKPFYYKKPLYYYCQRPTSLSNNKKMEESDMIKAFAIIEETLGDKYPMEIAEKSVSDLLYGGLLMMCKANKKSDEIKQFIRNYEKKYPAWRETEMLGKLGIAKKLFLVFAAQKNVPMMKLLTFVHSMLIKA